MKTLFLFFSSIFLYSSYSDIVAKNIKSINFIWDLSYYYYESKEKTNSSDFESFLMQFDLFEKEHLDETFFKIRKRRKTDMYNPELRKSHFSSFIPYDEKCNCDKEDFYYRPCYRIETKNFYIISFKACCDTPHKGYYPFDSDILITYNKMGEIIDSKIVGYNSDFLYYESENSTKNKELICTQYSFYHTNPKPYSGKCDVSVYKIVINDDGTIDKKIIRNYTDNVTISY